MEDSEMISIPLDSYNYLLKKANKLEALEACGVDNWQGYDDAMELLEEWYNE